MKQISLNELNTIDPYNTCFYCRKRNVMEKLALNFGCTYHDTQSTPEFTNSLKDISITMDLSFRTIRDNAYLVVDDQWEFER